MITAEQMKQYTDTVNDRNTVLECLQEAISSAAGEGQYYTTVLNSSGEDFARYMSQDKQNGFDKLKRSVRILQNNGYDVTAHYFYNEYDEECVAYVDISWENPSE